MGAVYEADVVVAAAGATLRFREVQVVGGAGGAFFLYILGAFLRGPDDGRGGRDRRDGSGGG